MSISQTLRQSERVRLSGGAAAFPVTATAIALALGSFWMERLGLLATWLVFATMAGVVLAKASHHPFASFGAANIVTLVRGGMVALLAGLMLEPRADTQNWIAFAIATTILAMDGVDGMIARRNGTVSRFGARFDMEIDALLIMVLAGFAWMDGIAGTWVLALGLMRYAFVVAGWAIPWLGRDLPQSTRRKVICVVQIAVLALLLLPVWASQWRGAVAGLSFALLAWSFAVDIVHLARSRPR